MKLNVYLGKLGPIRRLVLLSRYLHSLQSTGLLFSELSDDLLFRSREEDQVDVYHATMFNFYSLCLSLTPCLAVICTGHSIEAVGGELSSFRTSIASRVHLLHLEGEPIKTILCFLFEFYT